MYIVTIVNFEGKKVSSETFLDEDAAHKEWERCVEKYKAQSSNLELKGEKATKETGDNGGKAWAYEHEGFGAYLTKPEGGHELIESMSAKELAEFLEEDNALPDILPHLKRRTLSKIIEELEGWQCYALKYGNLLQEMEAKQLAESFNNR